GGTGRLARDAYGRRQGAQSSQRNGVAPALEGTRKPRVGIRSAAMNLYPPMLALTILFVVIGMWNSGLMGYPALVGMGVVLMLVLRYYSALWVIGLAVQTHGGLLRYFLLRSSILVATASPLVLVAAAYALNLNRFVVFLSAALAALSAGLTGEHEYMRL